MVFIAHHISSPVSGALSMKHGKLHSSRLLPLECKKKSRHTTYPYQSSSQSETGETTSKFELLPPKTTWSQTLSPREAGTYLGSHSYKLLVHIFSCLACSENTQSRENNVISLSIMGFLWAVCIYVCGFGLDK